jgi:hypothetical protein
MLIFPILSSLIEGSEILAGNTYPAEKSNNGSCNGKTASAIHFLSIFDEEFMILLIFFWISEMNVRNVRIFKTNQHTIPNL